MIYIIPIHLVMGDNNNNKSEGVARRAQFALGVHAAFVLVCMTCSSIIFSSPLSCGSHEVVAGPGGALLLVSCCCMVFAAFLAAMSWWMTASSWGNRHPASLFMGWTFLSCFCICMMPLCNNENGHTIQYMVHRFLVWSALFLIEQTLISHTACKVGYGVLLTGFLMFITHDLTRDPYLVTGYMLAMLWCWWVIYDSQYHASKHYTSYTNNDKDNENDNDNDNENENENEEDLNVFKLSLTVVCDITKAGLAACMYYPNKKANNIAEEAKMHESPDCQKDMEAPA